MMSLMNWSVLVHFLFAIFLIEIECKIKFEKKLFINSEWITCLVNGLFKFYFR